MADYPRSCHPAGEAPEVSNYYARCSLCGVQWQVRAVGTDTKGCEFCGAPARCVKVHGEGPRAGGDGQYHEWRRRQGGRL